SPAVEGWNGSNFFRSKGMRRQAAYWSVYYCCGKRTKSQYLSKWRKMIEPTMAVDRALRQWAPRRCCYCSRWREKARLTRAQKDAARGPFYTAGCRLLLLALGLSVCICTTSAGLFNKFQLTMMRGRATTK